MDIAEVMFPGGSPHLVEPIYKNPKLSAPFNEQLAAAVVARVRHLLPALDPGQRVRIVEIGSGSGGTSAPVMAALKAADGGRLQQHVDFLYTDISAQLVGYGRRMYGPTYPFARFKVLDVEKEEAVMAEGIGTYDIVFATNVLHATRNMSNTLLNCKVRFILGLLLTQVQGAICILYTQSTFACSCSW